MSPLTRFVTETLLQTALIFLFVSSVACLFFGAALLLRQQWSLRLSDTMNRWISTRKLMRPLEANRDIKRHLYRRHSWVGAFIVLGAAYILYFLFFLYNPEPLILVFRRSMPIRALEWLMQSLWWIVLVTNVMAIAIGLIMFFRPSMLKGIEEWADRNYSTREVGKFWETMILKPDQMVRSYPRGFGWFIVLGSLYAGTTLALILLGHFSH